MTRKQKKIWIDLDNSPHVPFFKPIIRQLEERGIQIFLTTRDCSQTKGLADLHCLEYNEVGSHFGKSFLIKTIANLQRTFKLQKYIRREKPDLAVSHGSRPCTLAAKLLHIPSILIFDYEYAKGIPFVDPTWTMVPEIIGDDLHGFEPNHTLRYPGLKEFVYASDFKPDPGILSNLHLDGKKYVVIRPPATMAHYHNPEAEKLFEETMNFCLGMNDIAIVVLPRYETQEYSIREKWYNSVSNSKVIIPDGVVNGLDLMWYSDGVVSGGGTMNREAAALGVPVYSIFRGNLGDIDRYLSDSDRLVLITSSDDIRNKIRLSNAHRKQGPTKISHETRDKVVENILYVLGQNGY